MVITAPISIGELYDKISILEIKLSKIKDKLKRKLIIHQLAELTSIATNQVDENFSRDPLYSELKNINGELWRIEEEKRESETNQTFDKYFIYLARQVYLKNDERAIIKQKIDTQFLSEITEVKSYV